MDDSAVTALRMPGASASSPIIQQPVGYSHEGASDLENIVDEDQRVPSSCANQGQGSGYNTFPRQTVAIVSDEALNTSQLILPHSSLPEEEVQGKRSSLDEILHYANKRSDGGVFDVINEPLPSSPSTSLPSKDSLETETGREPRLIGIRQTRLLSSLEMLDRHENSGFAAPAFAETIPLPPSEADMQSQARSPSEKSFQLDAHDPKYFAMVKEAAESIEHLKKGRIRKP